MNRESVVLLANNAGPHTFSALKITSMRSLEIGLEYTDCIARTSHHQTIVCFRTSVIRI